jgi:hypothetical protein
LKNQKFRIVRHGPVVVVLALLMVACGGPAADGGSNPPTPQSTAPAIEGTGLEPTPPTGAGPPAIDIASLPIGGVPDNPGSVHQCAPANWLDPPMPDGISVLVTAVRFEPSGVFTQSRSGCRGPLCLASFAFTSHQKNCNVPVTATGSSNNPVSLLLTGTVRCPARQYTSCKDFAAKAGTGSVSLTAPDQAQQSGPSPSPSTG